jgi:threonine/homoserine/homoserine lactone efflux protein
VSWNLENTAAVEGRPVGGVPNSISFSRSVILGLMAAIDGVVVFLAGMIIYLLYVGESESAIVYASACAVTALVTVGAFYISGLYELNSAENQEKRLIKIEAERFSREKSPLTNPLR